MLATWVSLHYNIYKNLVKLATLKISNHKLRKLMLMKTFCV